MTTYIDHTLSSMLGSSPAAQQTPWIETPRFNGQDLVELRVYTSRATGQTAGTTVGTATVEWERAILNSPEDEGEKRGYPDIKEWVPVHRFSAAALNTGATTGDFTVANGRTVANQATPQIAYARNVSIGTRYRVRITQTHSGGNLNLAIRVTLEG